MSNGEHAETGERHWRNAKGEMVAALRVHGRAGTGFRTAFEPPRNGWQIFHLEMVGMGDFACRASFAPNDFLADLIEALCGTLDEEPATVATAHGEPDSFEFRFTRTAGSPDIRLDLVAFPTFNDRDEAKGEAVVTLMPDGDAVCRAFCWGLKRLEAAIDPASYREEILHPFPAAGLAQLVALLGGESVAGPGGKPLP